MSNMCRVLHVHLSGYYAWIHIPKSQRAIVNVVLLVEIKQFYIASHHVYGNPCTYRDCKAAGLICSENRVATD